MPFELVNMYMKIHLIVFPRVRLSRLYWNQVTLFLLSFVKNLLHMSVYIKNCNFVLVYFLILSYDQFFFCFVLF